MKKLLLAVCCVVLLGLGSAWAGVVGTTDPTQFNDSVDWCQYGCAGAQLPSPQSFTSAGGNTGTVGLVGTMQGFYNLQQGNGWNGGFPAAMGLVYNGAFFGNTPTGIAATLDNGVAGVGAWLQDNYLLDDYTATIQLFDMNYQSLGSFSVRVAGGSPAIFIGAFGDQPVYAAQFDITDSTSGTEDFAMGTLKTASSVPTTPEPSSLLMLGSALGLAGMFRRRIGDMF